MEEKRSVFSLKMAYGTTGDFVYLGLLDIGKDRSKPPLPALPMNRSVQGKGWGPVKLEINWE